ncbi:S-adenosylmethionine-dependent methyltransferase Ecym_3282 [Eremothecium cymbalariae DBVPG|uniref:peptide chain release factor N(5)-glutamine methyltransferase n=1 Tax=Eremothecium cymbalariae (strain CBS 270.75 / DBVPG 7215 / KCTC 17166 / NRRL Y-17582) TaxID=931890 RepID=G8JRK6_ERECY|nr:Hypothetical protein Ecym_3282 [Eremothecium cymbalariae DBVPG\
MVVGCRRREALVGDWVAGGDYSSNDMTRLGPRMLREAYREHRWLPLLLRECRSMDQARAELQWMQKELGNAKEVFIGCLLRARHYPLQYILGTQPFGGVTVQCRPGVLIPRWETEEWACEVGRRFAKALAALESRGTVPKPIKVLDACTGTGCVSLLLRQMIGDSDITAVDVSPSAVKLAKQNSIACGLPITVVKQDLLLHSSSICAGSHLDLLTCNPPYIPASSYRRDCTRSVRMYEPKLALISDLQFYDNLINSWLARTDAFVYEIGDLKQCEHVIHRISSEPSLKVNWHAGCRYDSGGNARVVYGYRRKARLDLATIFKDFGILMH